MGATRSARGGLTSTDAGAPNRVRPGTGLIVVAVVSLAVVLLAVAASSGPVRVWSDPPVGVRDEGESPSDTIALGEPPQQQDQPSVAMFADEDSWWMRVLAVAVGLLLVRWAWIVVTGWWQIWRERSRERRSVPPRAGTALEGGADGPPVTFDLEARLSALRRGTPRNAIVACWCELEDDVAAAGIPRAAAETTAEYTERVLAGASVDAAAVVELADAYREARFSSHPLDDLARERAVSAVRRVHASLGAGAVPGTR